MLIGCNSSASPLAAAHRVNTADALWRITHEQCVPHQLTEHAPTPCAKVNLADQYVILKDRVGPLQHLLIPTEKISGIESAMLLGPTGHHLVAHAWQERSWLNQLYGQAIPDQALSLTINARRARTQNQLHIHISCLKPAFRKHLDSLTPGLNEQWQRINNGMNQHPYWARTMSQSELTDRNPFQLLNQGLPQAQGHMEEFGLGLATMQDGRFILLASQQSGLLPHASMEEIQDHECPQLFH